MRLGKNKKIVVLSAIASLGLLVVLVALWGLMREPQKSFEEKKSQERLSLKSEKTPAQYVPYKGSNVIRRKVMLKDLKRFKVWPSARNKSAQKAKLPARETEKENKS